MTELKPRLEYENGKPTLKCRTENGSQVTIYFADVEPETDVKQAVLDIITSQYKEKMFSATA